MSKLLKAFVRDERGVSAMEYAVLVGIVIVALGGIGATWKSNVSTLFSNMWGNVTTSAASSK